MLDAKSIDLEKELKEGKQINFQGRAGDLLAAVNFVKSKYGQEALNKVIQKLKTFNIDIEPYLNLSYMTWMPMYITYAFFITAIKELNWDDVKLKEAGAFGIYNNLPLKIYIKYFASLEKTLHKGPAIWKQYYSAGDLEIRDFNKQKRSFRIRITNFRLHPTSCVHLQGLFAQVVKLVTGSKNVQTKEVKCIFENDPYHEFIITW